LCNLLFFPPFFVLYPSPPFIFSTLFLLAPGGRPPLISPCKQGPTCRLDVPSQRHARLRLAPPPPSPIKWIPIFFFIGSLHPVSLPWRAGLRPYILGSYLFVFWFSQYSLSPFPPRVRRRLLSVRHHGRETLCWSHIVFSAFFPLPPPFPRVITKSFPFT